MHGNYLKRSIAAAGLDPDDLPVADKSKMNFGSGGNSKAKAWRDIWGAGQGVGQIFDAPPAAEIVARLKAEYEAARAALFAGETVPTSLKQAAEVTRPVAVSLRAILRADLTATRSLARRDDTLACHAASASMTG